MMIKRRRLTNEMNMGEQSVSSHHFSTPAPILNNKV